MSTRRLCTYGGCSATVIVSEEDRIPPRCERHANTFTPKKVYHDHHYHRARYFYGTSQWKKLRLYKLQLNPICEHCIKRDLVVAAVDVDHIVEIEDGGSKTDIDNLQSLCVPCHRKKTGEEKRKREEKNTLGGFNSLSDF
ncbi:hypothetical protein NVP2044O_53 [Vibrio phage 2.044.O._10N.261.51.B8]|nr:hypothetical protein NVP2044O_53 [Vibrio phage 2.044.O._10N.261.51.B8]